MTMGASGEEGQSKTFPGGWTISARACDSCKKASAQLFCRADSAFLCMGCDAKVHGANKLASRHERVWMCEVCEQAPASVTCKADAAALCVTCDSDIHSANPLSRRHERCPIVPFYEPPPIKSNDEDDVNVPNRGEEDGGEEEEEDAKSASWLLCNNNPNPNPNPKLMDSPNLHLKSGDYYFPDVVDPYLDLDYASSMDVPFHHHHHNSAAADSVVPVHTKPFPPHPLLHQPTENFIDFDFYHPKPSFSYTQSVIPRSEDRERIRFSKTLFFFFFFFFFFFYFQI